MSKSFKISATLTLWSALASLFFFMIWYTQGFDIRESAYYPMNHHMKWAITGLAIIGEVVIAGVFTRMIWRSKNDNASTS